MPTALATLPHGVQRSHNPYPGPGHAIGRAQPAPRGAQRPHPRSVPPISDIRVSKGACKPLGRCRACAWRFCLGATGYGAPESCHDVYRRAQPLLAHGAAPFRQADCNCVKTAPEKQLQPSCLGRHRHRHPDAGDKAPIASTPGPCINKTIHNRLLWVPGPRIGAERIPPTPRQICCFTALVRHFNEQPQEILCITMLFQSCHKFTMVPCEATVTLIGAGGACLAQGRRSPRNGTNRQCWGCSRNYPSQNRA